ncbi:MAG: hypothetical protein KJO67_14655 [Silicimonas sp.]|nr:hypothetical protein [Silicimonas sp.]
MPDFTSILTGSTAVAFVATVAIAFILPRLRQDAASRVTANIKPVLPNARADLPVEHDDPDWRECVSVSQHIADLMIADEWIEIAEKIFDWEANLTATPGGVRYHELATRTCLSGLQGLIDDAPRDTPGDLDAASVEVSHFVDTHQQQPGNHILAVLAARAHIVLGEAYREDGWAADMRKTALRKSAKHFIAAGAILKPLDPVAHMSPLLAEAQYLHALGSPGGEDRLQSLFQEWIDLDPSNSSIYDAHVAALVDRDLIAGEDVLREADEAMHRTEKSLGLGGYALFFMPILTEYESARNLLDAELYAAALMDLASNSATQAEVNHAAAALLTELESSDGDAAAAFRDTLMLLISQHLRVIYPRVWPISVEEVQELVAEAAHIIPDLDLPEAPDFDTRTSEKLAA